MVSVVRKGGNQLLNHRSSRSLIPKKLCAHIIVDPDDIPTLAAEDANALGTNEAARARNKRLHLPSLMLAICGPYCPAFPILSQISQFTHPRGSDLLSPCMAHLVTSQCELSLQRHAWRPLTSREGFRIQSGVAVSRA